MFRCKNLPLAFSYEALIGLFSTVLVFYFGVSGIAFVALLGFRPLIFEMEKIDSTDEWYYHNYRILLYSVYSTCALIILFYLVDILFIPQEFIIANKYRILLMIIPAGLFLHGFIGYFYFNKKQT